MAYPATWGAPLSAPTTSVLNVPVADTRANGVTLPLNAGSRSWFVHKAGAGTSTHLILDLSGYFNRSSARAIRRPRR